MKIASPPGDILEDAMEVKSVNAESLAQQTEVPLSCVEGILAHTHPVTQDVAEKFGGFFGTTTAFWLNLQRNFEERVGDPRMLTSCVECEVT